MLASHYGWFNQFERRLYDLGLNLTEAPAADAECAVVAIDSLSLATWDKPAFPISRHLVSHTRLVRSLVSAGAKLICFDVLFDQLDSASDADIAAFANACRSAGNVVLASTLEQSSLEDERNAAVTRLLSPNQSLLNAVAGVGLVDAPLDPDNTIRSGVVAVPFQDTLLPSLCAQATRLCGSKVNLRSFGKNSFLINYSWLARIPFVSYRDALANPEVRGTLYGKIVFIGSTVAEGNDGYHVPLNSSNNLARVEYGVFIHAAATQTLVSGRIVKPLSMTFCLILFVVFSSVSISLTISRRAWLSAVGFGIVIAGILLFSVLGIPFLWIVLPAGKLLFGLAIQLAALWILDMTRLLGINYSQQAVITDFTVDMQSAQLIQQHLQPALPPKGHRFDIAVTQVTCKEVGGDYYDFVDYGSGRVGILVGDVAGKGVSASLIMSNVQAIFREEAPKHLSPSAVFSTINTRLNSISAASGRFISLYYGILDSNDGKLTFSNAGHCNPVLRRCKGEIIELTSGGLFVGPFAGTQWVDETIWLSEGDVVCFYTDGVSEAYDGDMLNQFGEPRIRNCLARSSGSSQEILNQLMTSCKQFVRQQPFQDDWTAVILKFLG